MNTVFPVRIKRTCKAHAVKVGMKLILHSVPYEVTFCQEIGDKVTFHLLRFGLPVNIRSSLIVGSFEDLTVEF